MYKNVFDKLQNEKKLFKAYMFYGQCAFEIEEYAKRTCLLHGKLEDVEKLYYDDYDFAYAKNKLLQSSLFSTSNILLIKRDKKIPKKELQELIKVSNTNPTSTLIFCLFLDGKEIKSLENAFNPKVSASSVRFFNPSEGEALRILTQKSRAFHLDINSSALNHLYSMHNQDLSLCINDLQKLSIFDAQIGIKDINLHCFGIGQINLGKFTQDLFNAKDIGDDLSTLLEEGMNEIYLLAHITTNLFQLFMIACYIRVNGYANAKDILGFEPPRDIWEARVKTANFLSAKKGKFSYLLNAFLELELELKTLKGLDKTSYFQAHIRKISVILR